MEPAVSASAPTAGEIRDWLKRGPGFRKGFIRATGLIRLTHQSINVIASQRVGAKRRPMTGSAKQSSFFLCVAKMDCFVASAFARRRGFGGQERSLAQTLRVCRRQ